MSWTNAIKQVIEFNLDSGVTIIKVAYALTKPIIKYYQVPTEQLKDSILNGRSPETIRFQKLIDTAKHMDPKTAKEQIKKYAKGEIKHAIMRETGADEMVKSYNSIKNASKGTTLKQSGGIKKGKNHNKTRSKKRNCKNKTRKHKKLK
jgi:hypothetical protein